MGEKGVSNGVPPAIWTARKVTPDVRVVPLEETLWRLRMLHAPEQTTALIRRLER
jgi:hypothetical protein